MRALLLSATILAAACTGEEPAVSQNGSAPAPGASAASADGRPFNVEVKGDLDAPWAMTFLPTGQALITEKDGRLLLWQDGGPAIEVAGIPAVATGGQGGLGDVVLHPGFANNNMVYLSYAEAGDGGKGAAVGRGRLVTEGGAARIDGFQVIWRQTPKVSGNGHFGHRLAFSPDAHLFISNGDRQKFDPAQDDDQSLGKIVRLTDSGGIPADNPFVGEGGVHAQTWTKGHRNPLGIAFDAQDRLWEHEMGPQGGDEFNLIERGRNYGYPVVSDGDHYDGRDIPDHSTRPEFEAPKTVWTPVISPAGLVIYSGNMFPEWRGNALIGGLSAEGLVRVAIDGTTAREAGRYDMDARIREVEQGPDGAIWLLEDGAQGSQGRLLKLTPAG